LKLRHSKGVLLPDKTLCHSKGVLLPDKTLRHSKWVLLPDKTAMARGNNPKTSGREKDITSVQQRGHDEMGTNIWKT
jgi:hypothetical protein